MEQHDAVGFRRVPPKVDFPSQEATIQELWDRIDAFRTSIELRPSDNEYTFYDGPPFATGSPHYGHILAGVLKDIVPRYWTMRGYRIERRFGWDTHGLPVEMEVEKQLNVSGPKQILEFGVDNYNEACRRAVQRSTEDWEEITRRMGRWVDFENDYKTMDTDFMESVWWVFKQLWDKNLIYKAFKVLPYSYGATTPLSNFEANLDYRDTDDPSITVRLRITEGRGAAQTGDWLVIWTTTPWTLPSNLAVAVGGDLDYTRVKIAGEHYWVAEQRIGETFGDAHWEVVGRAAGRDLVGAGYEPPYAYFEALRNDGAFQLIASVDVTTDEGTGLVHMAPAYGEADFFALQEAGLDLLVDPVDMEARFTDEVPEVAGMNVKEADRVLIDLLAERGLLLKREQIRHSYPYCWRTGTPLIYKAIPTWFVRVESFRDRMVEVNRRIHWVPDHVGERRFGNWLEGARDWAISRNRYWGSCLPIWECDGCDETVCIGSIDELEKLSGVRLTDLHKHFVDPVTFACRQCDGTMIRVPEVLDCWFESGSMPYAQKHYPFENQASFEATFPAQFIAEGIDQTRGWFYTLVVLSTALFDREPFQNVVVNGHILAEDGLKMSKSLKNYPDPRQILDDFGADPLRAYLIDSPVLRAEPLRFSEAGVREVVRTVMIPLWNAYSFFTTYAEADGINLDHLDAAPSPANRPELDRWILSVLQSLVANINQQMEGYYLYAVIGPTLGFIEDLTNWYIRRSRRRFWRSRTDDDLDKVSAFATLYEVLVTFSKVLAPILPFVTEQLYQDLVVAHRLGSGPLSVHHCDYPQSDESLIDPGLEEAMGTVRQVVSLGHALRKQHQIKVRQPLGAMTVLTRDPAVVKAVGDHVDLISDELHVKAVRTSADETALVDLSSKADFRRLGPRLGAEMKSVAAACAALLPDQIEELLDGATLLVEGHPISAEDIVVQRTPREGVVVASEGAVSVAIDTTLTEDLIVEGLAREIIAAVQQLRREAELDVSDRIVLAWASEDPAVRTVMERHGDLIADEVLATRVVAETSVEPRVIADKSLALEVLPDA